MTRTRWPKGTWMQVKSRDILRALIGPEPGKRMSGRRLARYAEVHPSFIDHLLSGRRSTCAPATATRIAEGLAVPLEVLFTPSIPIAARRSAQRPQVLTASKLRPAA